MSLREEFEATGVVRLSGVFSGAQARDVADVIWTSIERRSPVRRDESSSWPDGGGPRVSFKNLRHNRAFLPVVESPVLAAALDEIVGRGAWQPPKLRAQVLITFPGSGPWLMPNGWHIDGDLSAPSTPTPAVRMFSFFGPTEPEGGGTLLLEGSHRLLARYLAERDGPIHGDSVAWAQFLRAHPQLDEIRRGGTPDRPGRQLVGTTIDVDGIPIRPVELSGDPGDMYLAAFHVFHTGAPNATRRPRQMLSTTAVTTMPG